MSFLDKITGKYVEATGFVLGCIGSGSMSLLGHQVHGIGVGVSLLIYSIARKDSKLFNFLKNFAEPTTWPAYVSLGVAAMFGAHLGGVLGMLVVGAMLMMNDGRTFDSLY